jgi:hypothetical protein
MKTGPDALRKTENVSESGKNENGTGRPRYRQKNSPGAQYMKTGPDALGTAENESRDAKHEHETRRPTHLRKLVRERKTLKRYPTTSVPPK